MIKIPTINQKGFSIIEYVIMLIIILLAILAIRGYVLKSTAGRYKAVGDSYGLGRQYATDRTISCAFDDRINAWYDEACFDNERYNCPAGDEECELKMIKEKCLALSRVCEP